MANKKTKSVALISLILAIVLILTAIIVILVKGYRFTTYDDGARFVGSVKSGQPYSGKVKYKNGMTALLDYSQSKIEYSNGDVYIGDINIIYRNGKGTLTYATTKDKYEGEFKDDIINGFGKYTYSDGSYFEGNFVNGVKQGYGKFVVVKDGVPTGEEFSGQYVNDMLNGQGEYVSADGSYSYVGNFVNDVQNGSGKCTYANGDTYIGNFLNNQRHGYGVYTWVNGESYAGNFINNVRDTRTLDKNGNYALDENGNYIHGEKATFKYKDGKTYVGYFEDGLIKVVEE